MLPQRDKNYLRINSNLEFQYLQYWGNNVNLYIYIFSIAE